MPIEEHDLTHEPPDHTDAIHELKMTKAHFPPFEGYHEVHKEAHRIRENIETPSDNYIRECKTKRLTLKEELLQMILTKSA